MNGIFDWEKILATDGKFNRYTREKQALLFIVNISTERIFDSHRCLISLDLLNQSK